jgi:hypothetical protein
MRVAEADVSFLVQGRELAKYLSEVTNPHYR